MAFYVQPLKWRHDWSFRGSRGGSDEENKRKTKRSRGSHSKPDPGHRFFPGKERKVWRFSSATELNSPVERGSVPIADYWRTDPPAHGVPPVRPHPSVLPHRHPTNRSAAQLVSRSCRRQVREAKYPAQLDRQLGQCQEQSASAAASKLPSFLCVSRSSCQAAVSFSSCRREEINDLYGRILPIIGSRGSARDLSFLNSPLLEIRIKKLN
jgi:hypothetical protein